MDVDAVLAESETQTYNTYALRESSNNLMVIHLNLSHPDALKREIFRNQNFRIGLSHAINRQEILDFLYDGEGKPWQAAPDEDSLFYDPQMGNMYLEFDPDKAGQFLDKAGFVSDQVGNRLGPDGLPISFSILVQENQPQHIAMLHMITKYWSDVGIRVQLMIEPTPLFLAAVRSNMHDAAVSIGGATMFEDMLLDPANYLPSSNNTYWAVTWANWYNRVPGFENQLPDRAARNSTSAYDQVRTVRDPLNQIRILKNALTYSREAFFTMGIATGIGQQGIVHKNFHNVPPAMPSAWLYPDPAPTNPEQYYISSGR
jgi:peptide/nickel transport system substrate-binding protein